MYEFFKNHPQKIIFRDVNLSNLENVLQRNLRADSQGVHLRESTNMETKILKILRSAPTMMAPSWV